MSGAPDSARGGRIDGSPSPASPIRLGLALSGGGFRAAAFHLGVLKRLEELEVLPRIEMLSTVSGGSITGALYALRCAQKGTGAPGSFSVDALVAEMRPVLTQNLRARAIFGTPWRALLALCSLVSSRFSRIGLMVAELDRRLFDGARLSELPSWIVINATNLRTGKAWKFYRDAAGDYLTGATNDTEHIRVTEAVAASAAYPGLTDTFAFRTRWEMLRGDLLDGRWERPPQATSGAVSPWRERFGQPNGSVAMPLVDGGLYDNEGMNGLRGAGMTHVLLSVASPAPGDDSRGFGPFRYLRLVEVIHDRLGAVTRALAHEMTHGVHPSRAAAELTGVARSLRAMVGSRTSNEATDLELLALAARVERVVPVGIPPRGPQFTASAQVMLSQVSLDENRFANVGDGGLDVPAEYRGLTRQLVEELSRVRTDLDALEPEVFDLLVAQAYFLTDCLVKLTMPSVVAPGELPRDWYSAEWAPRWEFATGAIASANANSAATVSVLRSAAIRKGVIGRVPSVVERWWHRTVFGLSVAVGTAVLIASIALVDFCVHAIASGR